MISVFEELGETSRRQILAELRSGAKSVNDLVQVTGLKQPNVSNHLSRMRLKGIVRFSKIGRQVYYSLASHEIETAVNAVLAVNRGCSEGISVCSLVDRFAHAAAQGDEAAAGQVLDEAFRLNAGMVDIYQDLLLGAMVKIRAWFEAGEIDPAQEHMASEVTLRMMSRTVQSTCPAKPNGRICVLGSAPRSWHVIPLRMAADIVRTAGWKALYLGPSVQIRCFVSAVQHNHPSLVVTNCCASEDNGPVLELIKELVTARTPDNPYVIALGGRAVSQNPDPFRKAGADLIIPTLRTFACEQLPAVDAAAIAATPASPLPN
jgi:methanogenic corrinoid protein MtbC1